MPPLSMIPRRTPVSLAVIGVAAALLALTAPCRAAEADPLEWGTCPESWVGKTSGVLGSRLQCATLQAPFDHVNPDDRRLSVGVVRIRAILGSAREGAIFFNIGGPGGHPGKLLRSMAEGWTRADIDDPDDADKRRLAERYDLVAVIPRGLVGSEPVACVSGLPPRHAFLPMHQDDVTWAIAGDEAQATADACTAPAHARYVNTEQHVHDMDMLRRSLGDERLHFYGISYGGKVGAWYAAMYPDHTGRLLLDSSMDFTHDYRTALRLSLTARQREFDDEVLGPLVRDPTRYGMGGSADEVTVAVDGLPEQARTAWVGLLDSPPRLAAALRLGEWLEVSRPADLAAMSRLIRGTTFSPDAALDVRIRWEATQLAGLLYAGAQSTPIYALSPQGDSVRIMTSCNDESWRSDEQSLRASLRAYAARFIHFNGSEITEELTCARWGGHSARQPALTPLERASPFLLIQSERDGATPLAGSSFILDRFANARMLLVRNSTQHGVFNFTMTGCIERTASHYLLTGELPESGSRVMACGEPAENPIEALPGSRPAFVAPVPVDEPPVRPHDEF